MIRTHFRPFWMHLRARTRTCLCSPGTILILFVFGMAGTVYWPSATTAETGLAGPLNSIDEGLPLIVLWLFWFYMWPMVPMVFVRGRATGKARSNPLSVVGVPAIPVGPGMRALAEAVLALSVMGVVRLAGIACLYGFDGIPAGVIARVDGLGLGLRLGGTVGGAIFLLPMALAWGLPAPSLNLFMWRPLVVAVLATLLHAVGGPIGTWPGVVLTGLVLSGLVLASARVEVPGWRWKPAQRPAESRLRPALPPRVQLTRDAWLPITRTWGPWLLMATLVFVVGLVLDVRGLAWSWSFFAGFEVFLIIGLQPLFRPFGLNVIAESLVGKHGAERGDFTRAWSVLPVKRESVLRGVWLHGIGAGFILWAVPVALLAVRTRLRLGTWDLLAADGGDLREFVILGAAVVPMMAGLLVAAALGRALETAVSGLIVLVGVYTVFPVKVVLLEVFGVGTTQANTGLALYLTFLVAVAAMPPLRFLHRVPRIEALE